MSTLNKSLPLPGSICLMDATRLKRGIGITMQYAGVIPATMPYVGWKQNSYSYSFQAQWKVKARLSPQKQLDTGVEYTACDWKHFNPEYIGNIDQLNIGVKADPNNEYLRYYSFAGKSIMTPGRYDQMTISVRVRSFNASKKQHGPWVSRDITVYCVPQVEIYKVVALADGGCNIYFDLHGWNRGGSWFVAHDITCDGKVLLEGKNLGLQLNAIGSEQAPGHPYVTIPGKYVKGTVKPGKSFTVNAEFKTCDARVVSGIWDVTVDDVSSVIDSPKLTMIKDNDAGRIVIDVTKSDIHDDWDSVSCFLQNLFDDADKCLPSQVGALENEGRRCVFYPDLDKVYVINTIISNDLGGRHEAISVIAGDDIRIESSGRCMINYTEGAANVAGAERAAYLPLVAAMNYSTTYSVNGKRKSEKETPFGRKKPVAFLGDSVERTIKISGSIDSTPGRDFVSVPFSSYDDWLKFQNTQGIILVRLPNAKTFHGLCSSVNLNQEDEYDEFRTVDVTFEEVDF